VNTQNIKVSDNLVVTLDYVLALDDGEIIDRSVDSEPFQFLQGRGQIIKGLEKALYGMHVGDKKDVVVSPGDGYGEYNPTAMETMPRENFPSDMELEEGQELHMRDVDTNKVFPAYVSEIHPDRVVLDFNHPLAGEELFFSVKITDLREATPEELDHGHVHTHGHHH